MCVSCFIFKDKAFKYKTKELINLKQVIHKRFRQFQSDRGGCVLLMFEA